MPSTLNLLTTLEWADNAVISLHLTPSLPRRLSRAAHQCCKVYANLLLSISIIVLLSSLFIFTFTTKKQQQNVDLEKVLWFPERYLSLDPVGDVFMVISDHFLTGSPSKCKFVIFNGNAAIGNCFEHNLPHAVLVIELYQKSESDLI